METSEAALVFLAVVLIAVWALGGFDFLSREKPAKDTYGPPPGMNRALNFNELGNRGWPEYPYDYTGDSASSVSHMVMRSA